MAMVASLAVMATARASEAAPIAIIEYTETELGGGLFQYDYTVGNETDPAAEPGVDLYDIVLDFPAAVTIDQIVSPSGWDSIPGAAPFNTVFINWFSLLFGGGDIAPGTSLSGFRLVADERLGALSFVATFVNPDDPASPLLFEGRTTASAAAVPEPASLTLLATGTAWLARRRRR